MVRVPGLTEFYFNNVLVANVVGGEDPAPGLPWVGYSDLFASVAGGESPNVYGSSNFNPFNASFGLIDNVRVYQIPEPATICMFCIVIGVGMGRRRNL